MRSLLLVCAYLLLVPCVFANTDGDDVALKKRATSVYQEILSPFCPGRSLNDCPSSKAHELKEEILVQLKSGASDDDVLTGVFARIGDQYRAIPKNEGFGKMVWIAPLSFLILGLLLAAALVSKRHARLPGSGVSASVVTGAEPGGALSAEMRAEVEKELAALRDQR